MDRPGARHQASVLFGTKRCRTVVWKRLGKRQEGRVCGQEARRQYVFRTGPSEWQWGKCCKLCSGLRPDACLGSWLMVAAQCGLIGSGGQGPVAGGLGSGETKEKAAYATPSPREQACVDRGLWISERGCRITGATTGFTYRQLSHISSAACHVQKPVAILGPLPASRISASAAP